MIGVILSFAEIKQYDVFSQVVVPNPNQKESVKIMQNNQQSLGNLTKILENNNLRETDAEKAIQTIEEIGVIIKAQPIKNRSISKNTISILARYLDLRKSSSLKPKYAGKIVYVDESQDTMPEDNYPAIKTFIFLGKDALPEITDVIKAENVNSIKSENAVYVLRFYFRGNLQEAVDYLHSVAAETKSEQEKGNLLNVAQKILVQLYQTK